MQVRNGKVYVSNGSLTVYGLDVDWSGVSVGDLFMFLGQTQFYWVSDINTAISPKQITLNSPYTGATITSAGATNGNYAIHSNFTATKKLPLISRGDIEAAAIQTRAMQLLDAGMTGVESNGSGVIVSQLGHGFIKGSLIYFDAVTNTWKLCDGLNVTTAIPDAIVSVGSEVSPDEFTYTTSGQIGVTGTLIPGSFYGAKDNASGGFLNLGTTATIFVPALKAVSSSAVVVVNIGGSVGGAFGGSGSPGTVSSTVSDATKFLRDDGVWANPAVADLSVSRPTLYRGTLPNADHEAAFWNDTFWANWEANTSPFPDAYKSVYWAIINLYKRLKKKESLGSVLRQVLLSGSDSTGITTSIQGQDLLYSDVSWTVPYGITKVALKVMTGRFLMRRTGGNQPVTRFGSQFYGILNVQEGDVIHAQLMNLVLSVFDSPIPLTRVYRKRDSVDFEFLRLPGPPVGRDEVGYSEYYDNVVSVWANGTVASLLGAVVSPVNDAEDWGQPMYSKRATPSTGYLGGNWSAAAILIEYVG